MPPRARSFDVAAVDPCRMLTREQSVTFGINQPVQGPSTDPQTPGSTLCTYINSSGADGPVGYGVSTDVGTSAASLASSTSLIGVDTVSGIGALVIDGRAAGCTYVLDTSDADSMQVGATSTGSTAALDCPKAKAMSAAIIEALNELQPG